MLRAWVADLLGARVRLRFPSAQILMVRWWRVGGGRGMVGCLVLLLCCYSLLALRRDRALARLCVCVRVRGMLVPRRRFCGKTERSARARSVMFVRTMRPPHVHSPHRFVGTCVCVRVCEGMGGCECVCVYVCVRVCMCFRTYSERISCGAVHKTHLRCVRIDACVRGRAFTHINPHKHHHLHHHPLCLSLAASSSMGLLSST